MQESGTTTEKSTSKKIKPILIKLFYSQIVYLIDLIFFHLKFSVFKIHKRSSQTLNSHRVKAVNTNEQMALMEIGRDNMTEFVRMVPDEVIVDLSHRWYCVRK